MVVLIIGALVLVAIAVVLGVVLGRRGASGSGGRMRDGWVADNPYNAVRNDRGSGPGSSGGV